MHPALRKGPLFYEKYPPHFPLTNPPFPLFYKNFVAAAHFKRCFDVDLTLLSVRFTLLRYAPLFLQKNAPFSTFLLKNTPIAFPAYGPVVDILSAFLATIFTA